MTKIAELQPRQGKVEVEGKITDKSGVREFTKFGEPGRVCNAVLQDDSGSVTLTLWNEDVDKVNVGDTVKISNGYVGEWQGEKQLSTGKFGTLEVVAGGSAPAPAAEPTTEPAPKDHEPGPGEAVLDEGISEEEDLGE